MTVGQDSRWGYNSISGSPIKKRTPRSFRHKGVPLLQVIKKVHSVLFIKKEYLHRAARQTATDFCLSNKKTLWWLISSGPHWVRNPSFDRVEAPASANTTLLNISWESHWASGLLHNFSSTECPKNDEFSTLTTFSTFKKKDNSLLLYMVFRGLSPDTHPSLSPQRPPLTGIWSSLLSFWGRTPCSPPELLWEWGIRWAGSETDRRPEGFYKQR